MSSTFATVKSLSLSLPFLTPSALSFAAKFNKLERLSLSNTSEDLAFDYEAPEFASVFKHLRSLHVAGSSTGILFDSITRKNFPHLHLLDIAPTRNDGLDFDTVLPEMGIQLDTLRAYEGDLTYAESLARDAAKVNPKLKFITSPNLPVLLTHSLLSNRLSSLRRVDDPLIPACRPFVETLSTWLADEVAQAHRNDDSASFVGLAAGLRTLELERLARIG